MFISMANWPLERCIFDLLSSNQNRMWPYLKKNLLILQVNYVLFKVCDLFFTSELEHGLSWITSSYLKYFCIEILIFPLVRRGEVICSNKETPISQELKIRKKLFLIHVPSRWIWGSISWLLLYKSKNAVSKPYTLSIM